MGIFDQAKDLAANLDQEKAKNLINENEQKIDQGVEQVGNFIDDKTGGKFSEQIDQAQQSIQDQTGNL